MKSYQQIFDLVKSDIDIVINNLSVKLNLQEPLFSRLKEFLNAPAKRIRPLFAILYLKAAGVPLSDKHYKLLTAVELVHNASLIHDDVIDEAYTRRNKSTLNKIFNTKLAVIAGDYLLSCAMEFLNEINNPQILESFVQALSMMCKGEVYQYFTSNQIPSLDDYIIKCEQKTARLFMTALECSAILSPELNRENALSLARNFGIAFQIKDDLTNVLTSNTDIQSGIYTAPVILSGNPANPAIEKTYDLLNNYIENTKQYLNYFNNNDYKNALEELMELYRK